MYPGCLPNHMIEERQDIIFRRVRGILNKITPETFDKLSKELVNVGLDSPRTLRGVIYLLFDKALKDLKYSSLYAKLCQILSEKAPNFEQEPGPNTFCKFLISKCEDEFERRRRATEDFDSKNELTDEEYEQRAIAKLKMLGNIKFICELGKKRLLQEEILHECIRGLLSKKKERPIQDQAQDFECLCQIMRTIGSLLDVQASRNLMNQYFERIDMFSQKPELPSRIRFMLKDVIDLRNNNWRPRPFQREDNVPQPLSKLREDAGYDAATNNTSIDKLGNNKNLLGISDLSKLHGRGLSSLMIDDDGPSFTTTTDFHWGPTSFLPLDEQPFDVFNSRPSTTNSSTFKTGNSNSNSASNTTFNRNKQDTMIPILAGGVDQSTNKRVTSQAPVVPFSAQANNSFNSANSFHKSLISQFNQSNYGDQRHLQSQGPSSQQPATMFNSSSNRAQDNNYNRSILTNSPNTKQQQTQRHHNPQLSNDKRNFVEGAMNQTGAATQHPIVSDRLTSSNNQHKSFSSAPVMKSRYDDNEPTTISQSRTFNNNNNSSINNNNNHSEPLHNQYQETSDLSHNSVPRRFGGDVHNKQSSRSGGVVSPVPNSMLHQQYSLPGSRQPIGRLHNDANEVVSRRQPAPPVQYPHQQSNNSRPPFDTPKPLLGEHEGMDPREPRFRSRNRENSSSDPNYTHHQQPTQNIQGPYQQQEQSQHNQNRHTKFSGGLNYRHVRGSLGDARNPHVSREQPGYFDKNHERTPESELNMNWRAKPSQAPLRRDGLARGGGSGDSNNGENSYKNTQTSVSPVQHSSSLPSASSAHLPLSSQPAQQNPVPGANVGRFSDNKFVENGPRFKDKPMTYSNPSTINRISTNLLEHKADRSFGEPSSGDSGNSGGFGRRSHQQGPNFQRGQDDSYNNQMRHRDRESGPPRFHRESSPDRSQAGLNENYSSSNPPRQSIGVKSDAPLLQPVSKFNDLRQPPRDIHPTISPGPQTPEAVRRNQLDSKTRPSPTSSQPQSSGPSNSQSDQRREANRPTMVRNASGEFLERREGGSRKYGFDRNQEPRGHQQRFRPRHDDDFGPNHREQRNQRSNPGQKGQHLDANPGSTDFDRSTNWRKDNPSNAISSTANNTNVVAQNSSTSKESSIPPNLAPFLNKPRTKVNDGNFSLRPSHNLINRTLSTTSKVEPESVDVAKQTGPTSDTSQSVGSEFKTTSEVPLTPNNVRLNTTYQQTEATATDSDTSKPVPSSNTAKNAARDFHVNKFVAALAEYSTNTAPNANRAAIKIKELKVPKSYQPDCLVTAMKQSILKTETDREQVAKLFAQLVPHVFDQSSIVAAFKVIFEQMKALEVETPKIKSLVAGFLSQALLDNLICLEELGSILNGGKHHPLFLLVLQKLQKAAGQLWLSEKFTASKINLMDMLPEVDRTKDRLANALKDRCLGFLDPMLTIEPDLWAQMVKERDVPPATVYRWIKDNVDQSIQSTPSFAHVLITCLLKYVHTVAQERSKSSTGKQESNDDSAPSSNKSSPSSGGSSSSNNNVCDAEKEMLTRYQQVLQAILKDKPMQLATLYSVQSFLHGLDFPKGSLLRWFHMLYDMNIVDDDVYFTWKEEINDEFPGKGQALFQVNTWLNWLAEDDSEEEEEEA